MPEPLPSDFVPDKPPTAQVVPLPDDFVPDGSSNSVMAPPSSMGQRLKSIGKTVGASTFKMGAAAAPIAAGAEMGAGVGSFLGPAGTLVGGIVGAGIGGFAEPAAHYLATRALGENETPPTYSEAAHSALGNMGLQMVFPIAAEEAEGLVESVLGIKGALELVRKGKAQAAKAGDSLAQAQDTARAKIAQRGTDLAEKVAKREEDLRERQASVGAEIKETRKSAAVGAARKYDEIVNQAERDADTARAKLREGVRQDVEKARSGAIEESANRQARRMMSKTPQQFQAEAAQPYEQRAAALGESSGAYFDASSNFHQEVGKKFEPYIGKIKNDPVAPNAGDSIRQSLQTIDATLEERGQQIQSPELKGIIKKLNQAVAPKESGKMSDFEAVSLVYGIKDANRLVKNGGPAFKAWADSAHKIMAQAQERGEVFPPLSNAQEPKEFTYGQLWGYRARANAVLAKAANPADRWAAQEIISSANDAIPGVPQAIRQQYAFERKLSRSVLSKVASARTPQEVGDAIFGSRMSPAPAEIPLQVIRFIKQYAPEKMDAIRQGFADHYLGNRMDANDLARMNPHVLNELYGDNADSVIRLLGPEGSLKQASWAELIRIDPQARDALDRAISESMGKQANMAQREAMVEAKRTLANLPDKYGYIREKVAAVKTPDAKLKVLAQELSSVGPTTKELSSINPTGKEAALLEREPPNIREGGKLALMKGARSLALRFETYMVHRTAFELLFMLTGAYTYLTRDPVALEASIAVGAGLGARAMTRSALATETGASLYMKLLDMKPSPANVAAFGRGTAALTAAGISNVIRENRASSASSAP